MIPFNNNEWTFESLEEADKIISRLAHDTFKLDTYPNQIEVITAEQMLDAYSSVAMPVMYPHWSFGKDFAKNQHHYQRGEQNLAYEIVANSDPCISYLMEENTMSMQTLVIAHACYGHNAFFKGNYLFKQWTQADAIIDYLVFARKYVMMCEERYGAERVESIMDSAHALQNYGVDKYKRAQPKKHNMQEEWQEERQRLYDDLLEKTSMNLKKPKEIEADKFPEEPEENLLYFIEKYSPKLEAWEKELVRIVRKIAQYFYPQSQTKVSNEGFASFWHYTICNELYNQHEVSEGFMLEFLKSHTNVVYQPEPRDNQFRSINPYALGFAMYQDIRRMSEHPTAEDLKFAPDIAGGNWLDNVLYAMANFKDESFIRQYLSPKVIRDFRLFMIDDQERNDKMYIEAIHNENGYDLIRSRLAEQYSRDYYVPDIQVTNYAHRSDRKLTLTYYQKNSRPLLLDNFKRVEAHIRNLWGFAIELETVES